MITARAARELSTRKVSNETYWVGRVDRKIRHAAEDGVQNVVVKFYQKLPEGLDVNLLAIVHEHGFSAVIANDELGNLTMAINWGTDEAASGQNIPG